MSADTSPLKERPDAGHVPMSEELDSPRWTLPPVVPVLIAAVAVGIVVWAIVHFNRRPPAAEGQITGAVAAELNQGGNLLASVQFHLRPNRDLWLSSMSVKLETAKGTYTDVPAPVDDVPRYTKLFPQLQPADAGAVSSSSTFKAGQDVNGFVVVSFPVTVDEFNQRKSLQLTINLRKDQSLVLHQP